MPKLKSWTRGLFWGLVLPAAVGVAAWQGWAWWSWAKSPVAATSTDAEAATLHLQIPPGTPGQQIGKDLESAGIIRSALAWDLWARKQAFQNRAGGFQAGIYALSPTQSLDEIGNIIWTGQVLETSFTIREGWNRQEMADYLEAIGFFPASAFMEASSQIPREQYPWLPTDLPHLEGFLYPDTYQLPVETVTAEAIIDQMLNRFEQVALPVYQQVENPPYSLLDWVTFSSIVEKEAVVPEERELIAGVFVNRLTESIPLASDPTVEYGLGIRQTKEQPLTWAQVETPSPYNTYLNPGLPPTPIASPGIASLEATLNPEKTDYLFFVARYDGTHVFSRTLAEHEAAQDKIRDAVESELETSNPGE